MILKLFIASAISLASVSASQAQQGFRQTQQSYPRVRAAYHEKGDSMKAHLSAIQLEPGEIELYVRAFKLEKALEIWTRKKGGDAFNPWSSFHLSMCIDYPNPSDRILGKQGNLGGNICIHGSCVTIGCIPLTDDVIKEVCLLCVEARNNGQVNIPVTIYPAKMNGLNYSILYALHMNDPDKLNLWTDLKTAYELFQSNHRLPEITFLPDGRHQIRLILRERKNKQINK